MKRINFLSVLLIAVFVMVMSMPLGAQGMKSGDNQQTMSTKKDAMWQNQYDEAQKLDNHSKTMNQDFQKLQDNFKNTMAQNNMSDIKNGLKQQETMMYNMQPTMEAQQKASDDLKVMVDKRSKSNMATDSEKTLAQNMMDQTRVMNEDYNSMQKNLKDMMNMDNMSDLKQAMQQHYKTMQNMSQMMTAQQDMAGNMMSMMNGSNMGSNMMQKNNMGQSGMQKGSMMDPTKKDMNKSDTTKTKSGKW